MNNENLRPLSTSEAREIGKKGGIASGKARRAKKSIYQLADAMLNAKLDDKKVRAVKQISGEAIDDEDMTVNAMILAGQVKSAMGGNVKAFQTLVEYQNKSNIDEEKAIWTIPITDITKDFVETYRAVQDAYSGSGTREIISKGGRGSIKSNFWAAVAYETIKQDKLAHVVYSRRFKTDLRGSVFNQFMKTVIRYNDLDNWDFKLAPMSAIYKPTKQMVMFVGADRPISLKSYNLPFGYVKLLIHEECDEMLGVEQMDNIEDTFLRSDTSALDVKIFNPPKSKNNFMNIYTEECETKEGTLIFHSYYYNVPVKWLGKRFFDRAEWFRLHKPMYYRNNYLGEVTGTGGGIFDNVEVREISDEEIAAMAYFDHGLDFGYEHPQTFIVSHYDDETDTLYCVLEVYSKRCKNSTFARKIRKWRQKEIIADSARPDAIAEMQDWGFWVTGAKKRWGSGKGRDYCWEWLQMANKIVVDPVRCPHLKHELITSEHEQLKDGTFSSAYPTVGEDCIMALIYANNRNIMESRRNDGLYDDEDEMDDVVDEDEMDEF